MKRNRNLLVILVVILSIILCAGCSGAPGETATAVQETPSPSANVDIEETPTPEPEPIETVDPEVQAQEQNRENMWIEIDGFEEEEETVRLDSMENEDGSRTDSYVYDDLIQVSIERVEPVEGGEEEIIARTADWEGIPAGDIDVEIDTEYSYPAFRLFYLTGDIWNIDLYMQTDLWDFRIHTSMPDDIPDMDEDGEYDYIEQTVIRWFYNVDIIDLSVDT